MDFAIPSWPIRRSSITIWQIWRTTWTRRFLVFPSVRRANGIMVLLKFQAGHSCNTGKRFHGRHTQRLLRWQQVRAIHTGAATDRQRSTSQTSAGVLVLARTTWEERRQIELQRQFLERLERFLERLSAEKESPSRLHKFQVTRTVRWVPAMRTPAPSRPITRTRPAPAPSAPTTTMKWKRIPARATTANGGWIVCRTGRTTPTRRTRPTGFQPTILILPGRVAGTRHTTTATTGTGTHRATTVVAVPT